MNGIFELTELYIFIPKDNVRKPSKLGNVDSCIYSFLFAKFLLNNLMQTLTFSLYKYDDHKDQTENGNDNYDNMFKANGIV